jgi:hypothetical protein
MSAMRERVGAAVAALATILAALAGCGVEAAEPGSANAASDAGPSAATSLHDDLRAPAAAAPAPATGGDEETVRSQLGSGGPTPKVFYLRYADGTPLPATNYNACPGETAPKFDCQFATTLDDCQRQIQTYLDRWYADFNIVFTLTRPTSGSYYTEVVSSGGGAWCNVASTVAGVAPFLCKDLGGGVAYTFQGGRTAKETAVIIAQEQAHLLGLEHTASPHDLMYPTICTDCDGFEKDDVAVSGDRCDRTTQNSYQMMLKALGPWGGGPKPSAFGCMSDSLPPTVKFLSPTDGAKMGHDFPVQVDVRDDCAIAKVEISVMPEGLNAVAKAPPYQWDLTGIDGQQSITVVATDGSGRTGSATLTITAPATREAPDPTATDGGGCTVASGAFGAAGALPSLAMLLLFTGHHRRSRRRIVTGELARRR